MNIMPSSLQCKAAGRAERLPCSIPYGGQPLGLWTLCLPKNYNQTLKKLKSHFSERRTMALVCKLEKYMMQLVQIMHKMTDLTDEYQKKVQKSEENNIKM
jgi:hypothetical protein